MPEHLSTFNRRTSAERSILDSGKGRKSFEMLLLAFRIFKIVCAHRIKKNAVDASTAPKNTRYTKKIDININKIRVQLLVIIDAHIMAGDSMWLPRNMTP